MCGLVLAKTTEGLYLGKRVSEQVQKERSNYEEEIARRNLLLADLDYTKTTAINDIYRIRGKLCFLFKSILSSIRGMDDKFIILNNYQGLDTIIYSKNGMLFKPKCTTIKEVEFVNNSNGTCYKLPIVKFKYMNKTTYGAMNAERIIKPNMERTECKNVMNIAIKLANGEQTIIVGKELMLTNNSKMDYEKSNFYENEFLVDNLYHSKYIVSSDNILDNFIDLLNFKSSEEITHIDEAFKSDSLSSRNQLSFIAEILNDWKKEIAFTTLTLIAISLTLCLTTTMIKYSCKNRRSSSNRGLNKRELELYNSLTATKA
jgi:hypothetical protein